MNQNPGKMVSMLYRKTQMFWAQYLKEYDLTSAEYPVLISLHKHDGVTQEDISTELAIDKSGITRIIKSLLEKGMIEKSKDTSDLRCNRIYLTDQGRNSKSIIDQGIAKWNQIISTDMDSETIQMIMDGLATMSENMDHYLKNTKGAKKHEQ